MLYKGLRFPKRSDRPLFYTNFVQTLDGKTAVAKEGFWPIGSKKDYRVLLELRAYADCLIHGGNLGEGYGELTDENLKKQEFIDLRKKLGKSPNLPYLIISSKLKGDNIFHGSLNELVKLLNQQGYKNVLVEGGPTLLGSFLKENLLDEIFITIAPKIYGTDKTSTLSLVEGVLFSPQEIKKLKLVSFKKLNSELFLRYRVKR